MGAGIEAWEPSTEEGEEEAEAEAEEEGEGDGTLSLKVAGLGEGGVVISMRSFVGGEGFPSADAPPATATAAAAAAASTSFVDCAAMGWGPKMASEAEE